MIVRMAKFVFSFEGHLVYACPDCARGLQDGGLQGFGVKPIRSCDVCRVRRAILKEANHANDLVR